MRVVKILDGTTVDGPGFRTSIYFAGCKHHCIGCHNPSTWDMDGGEEMSIAQIAKRVYKNNLPVTFSGGDPLYQIEELIGLAQILKQKGINIWCYTGFSYEYIIQHPQYSKILSNIDVLVDGEYIEALRDTSLLFRGSANQRLINLAFSSPDKIVEWESDF